MAYPGCEWQAFGGRIYSQWGEDIIALNIFHQLGVGKPTYLDLGAHHPFDISNTALLYLRGSRGINVEPSPNLIGAFKEHRPEDVNLCIGVAPTSCVMNFFVSDPASGRNSFVREQAEEHGAVTAVPTTVKSVNDIVRDHAGGVFPDFLSVDVEGWDCEIIKSIDYAKWSPKVICVEMFCGMHGQFNYSTDIKRALRDHYFMLLKCGANGIFVRKDLERIRQ
jgi:FkbM family methyltransferase